MVKKLFPHFGLDAPGRTVNEKAPQKTAQGDKGHEDDHRRRRGRGFLQLKTAGGYNVHGPAQELGDDNLGRVNGDQEQEAQGVLETVAGKVRQQGFEFPYAGFGHPAFPLRLLRLLISVF
jgi:hypothetical protein